MTTHIDLLRNRAKVLCLGFEQRIVEAVSSYYPDPKSNELVKCLHSLAIKIEPLIEISDKKRLDWICTIVENLEYYIADLHYANSEEIPRGLVSILSELSKTLFPGVILLASPQREYFYYSIEDALPDLTRYARILPLEADRELVLKPFDDRLDVIRFPRIERDNVLSYPIFGHELGHPIADDFIKNEETSGSNYKDRLEHATKNVRDYLGVGDEESLTTAVKDDVKEMLTIWKRGLEELISDCVGVLLFGPSALFAFHDTFLADNLDQEPDDPEYYPPPRYRLRFMMQIVNQERYAEKLIEISKLNVFPEVENQTKAYLDHLNQLVGDSVDRDILAADEITHISYTWIEEILPNAIEYARERLGDLVYSHEKISEEVPELIEKISIGIPPNEIGVYPDRKIADWRSSIVAG